MIDYATARLNMVEGQIRPNKVTDDRIVDGMMAIPRERFVEESRRGVAYVDEDVSIGGGRYVMEPMVLARLVQAADIEADDLVLEIGCGTGYASALIGRLASTVVALESDAGLAAKATEVLASQGMDNVVVVEGPLQLGYAKQAPYNVIFVHGAIPEVPRALIAQLADGGRLVTVVAEPGCMGKAMLVESIGGHASHLELFDASVKALPGFERALAFEF
jgi:protein-L-isoaspartate(D-aspartate) O-methyltransferase